MAAPEAPVAMLAAVLFLVRYFKRKLSTRKSRTTQAATSMIP